MKHLSLILLLSISMLADVFKLSSQELYLTKDNKVDEITFYSLNKDSFIGNELKSCIIEEKNKNFSIYCVHQNLKTYFGNLNGKLNPDNTFFVYSIFLNLDELELDLKPYSK